MSAPYDRIHLRMHQYWGQDISWCSKFWTMGLCARNLEGIAPEDHAKVCQHCLKAVARAEHQTVDAILTAARNRQERY